MQMGRPDLAVPHLEAAEQFTPQLSTPHYNLGVLRQQQGHLDAAEQEYQLALKYSMDPTEIVQARNNLGFVLLSLNEPPAAEKEFTAALQINPDKQNSLVGRGMAELRLGNLDAAVADLSGATEIGPAAAAQYWLGQALEAKGQNQRAEAAYRAALQLSPGMAEAQKRLDALRDAH